MAKRKQVSVCLKCGHEFRRIRRNQQICTPCINEKPYDVVIKKGNCTIQVHSELMTKKQLSKLFKMF